MRAIILAAGRGRRLEPMGWTRPKCLLDVAGQTLLDRTLASLVPHGLTDVTLVVGYKRELVEQAVGSHAVTARFVVNEQYATTNTARSLWLARDAMIGGFLYFNADVLFDPEIVTRLLAQRETALAIDTGTCGSEEVKVITDADGRVRRIGKELDPDTCLGEFIGVARFDASIGPDFVDRLVEHAKPDDPSSHFFEAALDELLATHVVRAMPIGDLPAIEIDTPQDYQRAEKMWGAHDV